MKLIAMMTGGLVFLSGISTVRAEIFSPSDAHPQEVKRASAESAIESDVADHSRELTDGDGLAGYGCNRIVSNNVWPKDSAGRVDLLIRRSRHTIQITFVPQPDRGSNHVPSRICSISGEEIYLKLTDPSVATDFGRTKRDDLFDVKFTHMPGPISLALTTFELIGVFVGFYRQRRSLVI
jgi:hypothetical protein